MSIRSRIRSIVLAGTLACSLGIGSLALAAEGSSSGAPSGEGAADLGSAISQIATNPGAPDAQGATLAYRTASTGPLTYQVLADWQLASVGDASQGLLYDIYTASNGVLQAVVINGTGIGQEDTVVDSFLGSMSQSSSMANLQIGDVDNRTLDDTLIRDVEFEGVVSGVEIDGTASFVFGSDYTGVLTSVYADNGSDDAFKLAHETLGLTVSNALSAAGAGFTVGAGATGSSAADATGANAGMTSDAPADQNAGTAGTQGDTGATTPDATPTQVSAGTPIDFEGFSYLVSTDPTTFVRATVESFEGDPDNGTPVIGVPVTITNNSGETKMPDAYLIELYGPKGLEQTGMAPYYFDDSIINVSNLRPGATVDAMIYFVDEGAGEYVAVFNNYSDQPQEISVSVQ